MELSDATEPARTMTALRWHGRGDIRIDRVPVPRVCADDDVLIEVLACGICGTDLEEWTSGPVAITTSPLILGHEFTGRVLQAGPSATVLAGDLVAVEVNVPCGRCTACASGRTTQCAEVVALGLQADGGLAELAVVPSKSCVPLPEGADPVLMSLAEPLAVAVHALERAELRPSDSILILGGGSIGILTALAARERGHSVVLIETIVARAERASRLGIRVIGAEQLVDVGPFDVCIEATGGIRAIRLGVDTLARGGTLVVVGVSDVPIPVSAWDLIDRELRLVASKSHTLEDFRAAVRLLAARPHEFAPVITERFALVDAVSAFGALVDRPQDSLKRTMVRADSGDTSWSGETSW